MNENGKSPSPSWQPLAFAVILILGVYIGLQTGGGSSSGMHMVGPRSALNGVLDRVEQTYVDPVVREELEQVALDAVLEKLDPHSLFISAEELAALAEPMEGNFEGIGVEFIIQQDTLMVVAAIPGGPSEKAGVRAGDRILTVDSVAISGPDLTNQRVMELLKGPRNTTVVVGLDRADTIKHVLLRRDRIPIHSVVCAANLDGHRGYIKVIRFAQNTAEEFALAMETLAEQGLSEVIVDLRGNGGGYLNAVVPMVESFLEADDLVVYTEGEHVPRRTYKARRDGRWKDWDVAVLVDESSASASEIFAGAIQDHDRGPVIGRRTFGKGLVQEEFSIATLGALRLTVARFYTPTGRAIQRPYGEDVDYGDDYFARYERGELFHQDSIATVDSLIYITPAGKVVHGAGGITPDVFVALDTVRWSGYLSDLSWTGTLRDAAFAYVDANRTAAERQAQSAGEGLESEALLTFLIEYAEGEGFSPPAEWTEAERSELSDRMAAQVIRNVAGEQAYYTFLTQGDDAIERAAYWLENKSRMGIVDGRLTLQ
ncbi:MAG: PDZ domain-containing protein [Crocinitomicaceae bacterium TMED209]|nr:MAG: PDZ domain-containing protein [Crocinitomicaceae bacterium TMED209]